MTNQPAIVFDTPASIRFYRLCSLRGMLRMESKGMKSRGGALRPQIAEELGLKPRDSYDKFIKEVQKRIDQYQTDAVNRALFGPSERK